MGKATTAEEFYTTGIYLEKNPLWHTEESVWKAEQVVRMLNRQKIVPKTIHTRPIALSVKAPKKVVGMVL
jgi:hypothetical protein